ncbi:MAG: hypothetical protein ACJ8AD_10225 [Gemmatimonadaceae bacterium]
MRPGPSWLLATVVTMFVVLAWYGRHSGRQRLNEMAGFVILGLLTAGLLYGIIMLVSGLIQHSENAHELLRSAAVLWATNILVFATGYWRLDAGGPNERERRSTHIQGAFLFPQMALCLGGADLRHLETWRPGFVDYLFVAFNTSTAFSPTDVPVLSAWAKLAMMVQATISFTTVILLVGRVVNIL